MTLDGIKFILSVLTPLLIGGITYVMRLTVRDAIRTAEERSRVGAEAVAVKAAEALDRHEADDQRRHEENLGNFKEVSRENQEILVRLARAGINGERRQ